MSGFDGCSIIQPAVATSLPAIAPTSVPRALPPSLVHYLRPPRHYLRPSGVNPPLASTSAPRAGTEVGVAGTEVRVAGTEVVSYSVPEYPSLMTPCFAPLTVPAVRNSSDARNSSR